MENLDWKVGELMDVPIDLVLVDENQPRESLNDEKIEEISISMRHEGFKRHNHVDCLPPNEDGKFPAVNGNHRLTAAGKAVLTTVPIMVIAFSGDEADLRLEQVASNQVLNMRPLEILKTAQMALEAGKSIVDIASKLGKSTASLQADLPILSLPPEIRNVFDKGKLPKVVARRLAEYVSAKKNVFTAWKWANKDNSTAEKMMAGITAYELEIAQAENNMFKKQEKEQSAKLAEEEKTVICMDGGKSFTYKDAVKLYDRLEKIVGKFDQSPIGNGHGAAVFTAKKGQSNQILMLAKKMTRIGKKIENEVAIYQAAH